VTRSAGFTLIEMLVVVLIMGLLVGLVSITAGPDDRGALRVEAERLAQLLDLAATESRFTGSTIGWTAERTAYRFWRRRDDAAWSEIRDSDLLRARGLPPGITISGLRVENTRGQTAMRLEFTPYGASSFVIELASGPERYAVAGSPVGDVRALPVEGKANVATALP
jgi:general secretion pathway protein H